MANHLLKLIIKLTLLLRRDSKLKIIGVESGDGFEKIPSDTYSIKSGDKLIMMVSS